MTWVATIFAIFFNTFVNPIALENIGWKYYIVFIVMLVAFGLTAFFFYPETKGHTLEQMAVLFDGDAAGVPLPSDTVLKSTRLDNGKDTTLMSEKEDTSCAECV